MRNPFTIRIASFRKKSACETGLTLIEILVSMMVFMAVSAGVAGTLTQGLQTTVHTRLATMGKSVAQEQIEEMRSRIYYVPYSTNPDTGTTSDVDLLDRYYPGLSISSSQGWQGWYTNNGGDAFYTLESPADDRGIVTTVETRFVDNAGDTIVPPSSYNTNVEGSDTPPSNLVAVIVTTSWSDRTGDNSYRLDTLISSTGQAVQGSGDAGDDAGEQGCTANSNSYVDVFGGKFKISTGIDEPYDDFIEGNFGEGHASITTGCETDAGGHGKGGTVSLFDAGTLTFIPFITGSQADATAPPDLEENDGPINVGPTSGWPTATITNSKTEGEAEASVSEIEAEGEASVGSMILAIQQIDGWPGSTVDGYKSWDFLNPIVQVTGGTDSSEDDPDHQDDQAEAEIEQEDGTTEGEGEIYYQQINIMPMQAKTSSTPSALQGLVFVRNFRAEIRSVADGTPGGAANPVKTYSAIIGVFNASKSSSCTGDACYDLYSTVGSANPIQTAINLASSNYRLQNALFTDFHSYTTTELNNASLVESDGTTASFTVDDGLITISAKFGTEVRWKTSNPHANEITLINQQGLAQIGIGVISTSINQD